MNWFFRAIAIAAVALRFRPADTEDILTYDEEASLRETLGDALRPDGTIDMARLKAMSKPYKIDDLGREDARADQPMAPARHP